MVIDKIKERIIFKKKIGNDTIKIMKVKSKILPFESNIYEMYLVIKNDKEIIGRYITKNMAMLKVKYYESQYKIKKRER